MSLSIRPITQMLQRCRIIGALLALLLLPACSAIKLAYNNAPDLTYWWLDSYFDFNESQSHTLRTELARLHDWHRGSELSVYLRSLARLQAMAMAPVTPDQACELRALLQLHGQTLIERAAPAAAALAASLSEAQIEHLVRQLDKRQRQWREEWLEVSPTERQERRVKQLAKRADMFYGRLEEAQWTLLRARMANSVFDATLTASEMQRRHQDIAHTLRQVRRPGGDPPRLQTELQALARRALDSPDPVYHKYQEQLRQETCATLAALHNSSSPAQRIKVAETLRAYENDARALLANGARTAP